MSEFKELDIKDFSINPFTKVGKEWMLISAKKGDICNAMTASWGGFGVMWGKNVSFIGIRPQRYTKEFVEASDTFSLCFFDEKYRNELNYFGSVSGRDENKIEKTGLSVTMLDNTPVFEEANLVIICKKLYEQDLLPSCFVDSSLDSKWHQNKDYHTMYFSEVQKIYTH